MLQLVKRVRQILLCTITNAQRLYQTAVFMTKWGTASSVQRRSYFSKTSVWQHQRFKTANN